MNLISECGNANQNTMGYKLNLYDWQKLKGPIKPSYWHWM